MRRRYYVITLILAVGGLLVGSLLLPRGGEIALIYYRAGHYSTAISLLEKELQSAELTASNVHYGALTYLKLGRVEDAARLVERYIRDHPKDVAARRMLGRLYHEAGKPSLFLYNLERLEAVAPSTRNRVLLKEAYWQRGMYKRWEAMLRTLVRDGDGAPEDYAALARLEASKGQKKKAIELLAALRERSPAKFALSDITLMATLYLDTGQTEKAVAAVEAWLTKRPDVQTALDLAFQFQRRGRTGAALRVLDPFTDKAPEVPKFLRSLTDLEIAAGKAARAQKRLEDMEKADKLAATQMDLLVDAALANRDWAAAQRAFAKTQLTKLSRELVLRVLNEAAAQEDRVFGARLAARIDGDFRRANPVAAARLALLIDDREGAARWADYARGQTLGTDDRLNLVALLVQLGRPQQAEEQLRQVSNAGGISDHQLIQLAVLLRKFGMVDNGKTLFERLVPSRQSAWLTAARKLLGTGRETQAEAYEWLDTLGLAGREARELLSAIYGGAFELKLFRLAAETAGRLVAIDDTLSNRIRQARALALGGDAEKAFAILKPLLGKDPEARQAYAEAVIGALKAGTMKAEDARAFLRDYLRDDAVPLTRRRFLIYDLLAMKAYDTVLPVTKDLADSHPRQFAKLYYETLIGAGDKATFAREVSAAIDKTDEPGRLETLGRLAFQQSQLKIAKKAYAKLLARRPDDPAALRHLGLIAAWSQEPQTARRMLTRYLAKDPDDYKAAFSLAEVVSRYPDWRKATPYYERVIRAIGKLKAPTLDDLEMRARALHRTGRFDAAIRAYEGLIRKHPGNRKLFNEYVDFLYEIGRYDRARRVLDRS